MSILSNYHDDTSSNCAQDAKQREKDLKTSCVTSSAIKPIKMWVAEMLRWQQQESSLSQGSVSCMAIYPSPKFARRNGRSRAGDSEKAVWLTLATPGCSSSAKLEKIQLQILAVMPSELLHVKCCSRTCDARMYFFSLGLQATESSTLCLSRFRDFCVQKISCESIGEQKAFISTSTHLWPCKLSYMTWCLRGSEERPPSSTERKLHIGQWHYCSARDAKGTAFKYCPRPSRWTVRIGVNIGWAKNGQSRFCCQVGEVVIVVESD